MRGYVHEKMLLDSMEALQFDDNIESALLVLAYELCDRFNLYDCKDTGRAQPTYYLQEWLSSPFDTNSRPERRREQARTNDKRLEQTEHEERQVRIDVFNCIDLPPQPLILFFFVVTLSF
ncbi:hypothetical protein ACQY0O_007515 [Thecaphora frezii]